MIMRVWMMRMILLRPLNIEERIKSNFKYHWFIAMIATIVTQHFIMSWEWPKVDVCSVVDEMLWTMSKYSCDADVELLICCSHHTVSAWEVIIGDDCQVSWCWTTTDNIIINTHSHHYKFIRTWNMKDHAAQDKLFRLRIFNLHTNYTTLNHLEDLKLETNINYLAVWCLECCAPEMRVEYICH